MKRQFSILLVFLIAVSLVAGSYIYFSETKQEQGQLDITQEQDTNDDQGSKNSSQLSIEISKPQVSPNGEYSKSVEINVTGYSIKNYDNFEIVKIEGTKLAGDMLKPQIPGANVSIKLPKNANVTDLNLVENVSSFIGNYNIPSAKPVENHYMIDYTEKTDVMDYYPDNFCFMSISSFETYKKVDLFVLLVRHNPQTENTILENYIKLNLTYQTPTPVTIIDFSPQTELYSSEENENTSIMMESVVSENIYNLHASLTILDQYGNVIEQYRSENFDLNSGARKSVPIKWTVPTSGGSYQLEGRVFDNENVLLADACEYFSVFTGEILSFETPETAILGENVDFQIEFRNYKQDNVTAQGKVILMDSDRVKVVEMPTNSVEVAPDNTAQLSVTLNTEGMEGGNYTALAYISTVYYDGSILGPVSSSFSIETPSEE